MAKSKEKVAKKGRSLPLLNKLYRWLIIGESSLQHPFLLIIRLYWGVLLFFGGFGKLSNISNVSGYFAELQIPYPLVSAYLVSAFETLGGVLLVLGFLTRLITIPLIIIMLVAYFTAYPQIMETFWSQPQLFINQDPFLYLFVSLIVMIFGPGAFSIDYWMEKKYQ